MPKEKIRFHLKKNLRVYLLIAGLIILGLLAVFLPQLNKGKAPATDNSKKISTVSSHLRTSDIQLRPPLEIKVNKIAFLRDNQVWLSNPDGSNQEQVTQEKRLWKIISWSPDGSKLALRGRMDKYIGESWYSYQEEIPYDLFYYDLNKKEVKRVTKDASDDYSVQFISNYCLSWFPDSSKYSYLNNEGLVTESISGERKVIIDRYEYCPTWSPSGQKLLYPFNRTDTDGLHASGFLVENEEGKTLIRIDDTKLGLDKYEIVNVFWGRDDNEAIFIIGELWGTTHEPERFRHWYPKEGGDKKILLVDITKPKDYRIVLDKKDLPTDFVNFQLSPNKNYIAFVTKDKNYTISVYGLNGILIKSKLGIENVDMGSGFTWSPKEDEFAFSMFSTASSTSEIWKLSTNGEKTKILDNASAPVWSPN